MFLEFVFLNPQQQVRDVLVVELEQHFIEYFLYCLGLVLDNQIRVIESFGEIFEHFKLMEHLFSVSFAQGYSDVFAYAQYFTDFVVKGCPLVGSKQTTIFKGAIHEIFMDISC